MSELSKHYSKEGNGFYVVENTRYTNGHTNPKGQRLTAPERLVFAFKRPGDPPGMNHDPVDVLAVLADHLGADALRVLVAEVTGTAVTGVPAEYIPGPPKNRGGRPRKIEPEAATV